MKTFIAMIILFVGIPSLAHAGPHSFCEKKWGDNYKMQEFCLRKQQAAEEWVTGWFDDQDILDYCTGRWTKNDEIDFSMVKYCIVGQQKEKKAVEEWDGDRGILERCWKKWSEHGVPNYKMIKYCADKQQKSLEWIRFN